MRGIGILLVLTVLFLMNGCRNSCSGGEVSFYLNGFPIFISSPIRYANSIDDKIYISFSERDEAILRDIAQELRKDISNEGRVVISIHIGGTLYLSDIYFYVTEGSEWDEIVIPNKSGAKEVFSEAGICLR